MFRERILQWTRIIDLFAVTKERIFVLAKTKPGLALSMKPKLNSREMAVHQTNMAAQREIMAARLRLTGVNR